MKPSKKLTKYLTVTAGGDARITTKRPQPKVGEATFLVNLTIPQSWNDLAGTIDLTLPDPPPIEVVINGDVIGSDGQRRRRKPNA